MTPARPMACVYEKWYRGIVQAVPDPVERCALLEYIVQYQLHVIYGAGEQPNKEKLPQAARIAVVMLEGDLEELCASRIDYNEKRKQNGRKSAAADTLTDPNRPKQTLTDPNRGEQGTADPNRPKQTLTDPSNQIKSNQIKTNQIKSNQKEREEEIFVLGLNLIKMGRLVNADKLLQEWFVRKGRVNDPTAYFAKIFPQNPNTPCAECIVQFVQATESRDLHALEIYNIRQDGDSIDVLCTEAAAVAIGERGKQRAQANLNVSQIEITYSNGK